MPLKNFESYDIRNLNHALFAFGDTLNVFMGLNGSGKTSILEAIFYLSHGRSFRTNRLNDLIAFSADQMTLVLETQEGDRLALQRLRNGELMLKHNALKIDSFLELIRLLPVQFVNTDTFRLLSTDPKNRRRVWDWGVFHTHPSFGAQWRQYQRLLLQRNAALKHHWRPEIFEHLDTALARCGEALHAARETFSQAWSLELQLILPLLLPVFPDLKLCWDPGWSGTSLWDALQRSRPQDLARGFTSVGPHRFDWSVHDKTGRSVVTYLSLGQQKMLIIALQLALNAVCLQHCDPVLLLDDLPSELDHQALGIILRWIAQRPRQTILTALPRDLDQLDFHFQPTVFHVEHGSVKQMV